MRKAERLFQLVNLIRVHQPVTAASLAERLGLSVRSIYRYIDDLSLSGIPVYGEAGVGYAMHTDHALPPLNLTRDELEALTVSLDMLARSGEHALTAAARSLQAKIEAVMPEDLARPDPAIRAVTPPPAEHVMLAWDRLRQCIRQGHGVRLHYRSLAGDTSIRDVHPLGLFYWGGNWTLGAWCHLRGDYRNFRVDLIRSIAPGEAHPPDPARVNLAEYVRLQREAGRADAG